MTIFQDAIDGKNALSREIFSDVIHLAAIVRGREVIEGDPLLVSKDLALDSLFFLWATRRKASIGRVLYASSSAAYPVHLQATEGHVALVEDQINFDLTLGLPDMTYGWSKVSGEFLARIAHKKYGMHVACIRPFSGYGEEQDLTYPIPSIAARVARREDPLVVWGDGLQGRDFVHIDDCVQAALCILDHVSDGSGVNIGTGELVNFLQVAKEMSTIAGYTPEIRTLSEKPVGVASRYADPTVVNSFGWKPSIARAEGFARVIAAQEKNQQKQSVPSSLVTDRVRYGLVTTTIHVPKLLAQYATDCVEHGHGAVTTIFVVADKKTPPEAEDFCRTVSAESGVRVEYLSVPWQETYLAGYPELRDHLPYNSIMRRNIGILYAYEQGCTHIATIDDDNFLSTKDFLGTHARALGVHENATIVSSDDGWYNICDLLEEEQGTRFFHRGFSPNARTHTPIRASRVAAARVVVNAGLWLEDPDIDAVTRMATPPNVIGLRQPKILLEKETYSPFNSQNTMLAACVIPAYFLSPLVGRYDDIWGSYIVKRIADHLGDSISFGEPMVRQTRNPHNLWKDLEKEKDGWDLTDFFCETLRHISLQGQEYGACYREVANALTEAISKESTLTAEQRTFLEGYVQGMEVWCKTMERVGKQP